MGENPTILSIVVKDFVVDVIGGVDGSSEGSVVVGMDEDGFQMYGSRRGRYGVVRGLGSGRGLRRFFSFDRGRWGRGSFQGGYGGVQEGYIARMYGELGPQAQKGALVETRASSLGFFSNPKYFFQMGTLMMRFMKMKRSGIRRMSSRIMRGIAAG